ncbi:MAG: hypothetical protein AB7V59_09075 [Gammaproteobacteria bacterium]
MQTSPQGSTTRRLLERYLDEHLAADVVAPTPDPTSAAPAVSRYVHFRVGPFQFVLAAAAVGESLGERSLQIAATELVPVRYRDRLAGHVQGPDMLVLKGGRIGIAGCLRIGILDLPPAAVSARGLRPESPWIMGSVQQPPSFVVDPDALMLHFGRRG